MTGRELDGPVEESAWDELDEELTFSAREVSMGYSTLADARPVVDAARSTGSLPGVPGGIPGANRRRP